jgi:hypothetical protein
MSPFFFIDLLKINRFESGAVAAAPLSNLLVIFFYTSPPDKMSEAAGWHGV